MSASPTEAPQAPVPFEFKPRQRQPLRPCTQAASAPNPRIPTPGMVARRAQALRAVPPLERRRTLVEALGVQIEPRAIERAEEFGFTATDLALAALEPEQTWPGQNNHSEVRLRGDVAAVVADDEIVVAMAERAHILRMRTLPRQGAIRRTSGGAGSAFPSDTAELLKMAKAAGITVIGNRNHYILRHPSSTEQVVAARTPSDHHAIPNTVMEIKRRFGVSLRKGTQ